MARTLHITNGDSVSLRETGLGGDVLAWRDVLHEGPVPAGLTLDEMRPVRARFLAELSGQPESEIVAQLEQRDGTLAALQEFDQVVLWFEHDLYDQLQLIQVLDWFAAQRPTALTLIDCDRYLGPMKPDELAALYPSRTAVNQSQLDLASQAWLAFSSADPRVLARLLHEDTSALPNLSGALQRHLEQFPSEENGLSRTERQILEIVVSGVRRVNEIFRADQSREERIFMGDLIFYGYIEALANARTPLLRNTEPGVRGERIVEITPEGDAVLERRADHIELNGIDRWLGGVHLHADKVWRKESLAGEGPASWRQVWRWNASDRRFGN